MRRRASASAVGAVPNLWYLQPSSPARFDTTRRNPESESNIANPISSVLALTLPLSPVSVIRV